jgi:hypothetical protein
MGRLVNPKRKWVCKKCKAEQTVWEGKCRACGEIGTLEEFMLMAVPGLKSSNLDEQHRLARRAKNSEREIARRMLKADGPDPAFANIISSTGRVGHITGMRIDAVSKTYVTENKNRKMPSWLIDAWILINQRAVSFNKNLLLHVDPPNMPREFPCELGTKKLSTMAIITQERHEELIRKEQELEKLLAKEQV